jgi:hypothetical protein
MLQQSDSSELMVENKAHKKRDIRKIKSYVVGGSHYFAFHPPTRRCNTISQLFWNGFSKPGRKFRFHLFYNKLSVHIFTLLFIGGVRGSVVG